MTTEEDFQALLDANPDDHGTRLVFADWLEERGDPRAEGYRALGVGQIRPWHVYKSRWVYDSAKHDFIDYAPPPHCLLPSDLYDALPRFKGWEDYAAELESRREQEDMAALAFAKLPAARRAELLAVPVLT